MHGKSHLWWLTGFPQQLWRRLAGPQLPYSICSLLSLHSVSSLSCLISCITLGKISLGACSYIFTLPPKLSLHPMLSSSSVYSPLLFFSSPSSRNSQVFDFHRVFLPFPHPCKPSHLPSFFPNETMFALHPQFMWTCTNFPLLPLLGLIHGSPASFCDSVKCQHSLWVPAELGIPCCVSCTSFLWGEGMVHSHLLTPTCYHSWLYLAFYPLWVVCHFVLFVSMGSYSKCHGFLFFFNICKYA